jgi:DDE family transposase
MRLSVATLRRVVKGDLRVEFVRQELTSYSGLELLRRYVRQAGLVARLRAACAEVGGDYGGARLVLLVLALFYAGARRLEHLRYLAGDPLIARFCGLARLPTPRTVANWLRQFTQATLGPLVQLNQELVTDAIARLKLPRLTIDVDGTVVCTGATVAWAFRGFNPHHRKDLSYYPLLAHLAQTGHILRCKNRPGNVHDSKQAAAFLRELIESLRARFGRRLPLEFRMDAAFCQPDVFRLLAARGCGYAIKVGYWHWLPLKQLAAARQRWLPIAPKVTGFFHDLDIPQWQLRLRVMIYRTHVQHESPRNFQLDLFTPDDGHYEYAAVATNLDLDLRALYRVHLRPRRAGEDHRRAQGGVRPRRRPHQGLRRQQRLAATQRPGPQPHPQLPTRYPGGAQGANAETHLRLPVPQHAHSTLPAHRPGGPAGPDRRPPRVALDP